MNEKPDRHPSCLGNAAHAENRWVTRLSVGTNSIPIVVGLDSMIYPWPSMWSDSATPVPRGQIGATVGFPSMSPGQRVRAGVPDGVGVALPLVSSM
jgi:hypothetical protein